MWADEQAVSGGDGGARARRGRAGVRPPTPFPVGSDDGGSAEDSSSADESHVLRDCNKCGDVVLADPQMAWDAVRCKFCRQGGKMRVGGGGSASGYETLRMRDARCGVCQ